MKYAHVLTARTDNRFCQEVFEAVGGTLSLLSSLQSRQHQPLERYSGRDKAPAGASVMPELHDLVEEFPPDKLGKKYLYESYALREDLIILQRAKPLSRSCRSERGLVLVNVPISFSDVAEAYPRSVIAGYASSDEEQARLQKTCGQENAFFLRYGRKKQEGTMPFIYGHIPAYLDLNGFRGIILSDEVDAMVAETSRDVLIKVGTEVGCGSCIVIRRAFDVQRVFLKEHGNDIGALFRYSVFNGLANVEELPLLGKAGRCSRYHPRTQEFLGRGISHCGGTQQIEMSRKAAEKFFRQMRRRYKKYKDQLPRAELKRMEKFIDS